MAATVPRPALPDDPRVRVLATAVHMHTVLCGMPWVVQVLGLGDLTDKGALWMVEEIVASAVACGLTLGRQGVRGADVAGRGAGW